MPFGAYRRVIFVGSFAVKIPRLRNLGGGLRSNRWEREMWMIWRHRFGWKTLCPVLFADPWGIAVVMPRAQGPVQASEIEALPDYYPEITVEFKADDFGRLGTRVVAVDYGVPDKAGVQERRSYYQRFTGPAVSSDA